MRRILKNLFCTLKKDGGMVIIMKNIVLKINYFSKTEKILWILSVLLILGTFLVFDRQNYLKLTASLIGVTALIFIAKGNPIGQFLTIVFSIIYGIISYECKYYGEMITYVGMTMPMAVFALVSWLRHPYQGNRAEVEVNRLKKSEYCFLAVLSAIITAIFYVILKNIGTNNLAPSTVSVTTSFVAVYLTFRRSPNYALGYAANDIVLIILWTLATIEDISYISVLVCFIAFFASDLYGFVNWKKMEVKQNGTEKT